MRANWSTATESRSTVGPMISAPPPMRTPAPRKIGPVSVAVGSISTSPPANTPGRISTPSGSAFIFPSSRSAFARLYSAIDPTSVQYPSATYPNRGSPSARSWGKRSLLKSNFSPIA